jgi:hypothetical protein
MTDKKNAEEKLQEIWENIIEEAKGTPQPNEKTILQFADETGLTRWQARYFLEQEMDAGNMTRRKIRNTNYYSPVL